LLSKRLFERKKKRLQWRAPKRKGFPIRHRPRKPKTPLPRIGRAQTELRKAAKPIAQAPGQRPMKQDRSLRKQRVTVSANVCQQEMRAAPFSVRQAATAPSETVNVHLREKDRAMLPGLVRAAAQRERVQADFHPGQARQEAAQPAHRERDLELAPN